MKNNNTPKRAIINFTKKCALQCEWCYVPFDLQPVNSEKLVAVIERLNYLDFESITFGGGDPFQFRNVSTITRRAKELGFFVHVDTHTITLPENLENSITLKNSVDLIGVPIDGSNPRTHDLMRGTSGHFDLVVKKLAWLMSEGVSVKINTMISAINLDDLERLAKLILKIQPTRWSIYQFWPIGPATKAASLHALDDKKFKEQTSKIDFKSFENKTFIEVNTAESRRKTYPILNHIGDVYVHQEHPLNNFEYLGSIFEDKIMTKIAHACNQEREQAASRYIIKTHGLNPH